MRRTSVVTEIRVLLVELSDNGHSEEGDAPAPGEKREFAQKGKIGNREADICSPLKRWMIG